MADEEVKIRVTTETEIEPLQEMDSLLDEIQEKTEVQVSVDDSEIEEATDKTTELTDELDNVDDADPSIDVDDAALEDATDKASELADELDSIDGTSVSVDVDTSGLEDAKASAEETASSMDSIATAAAGIGATAGIEEMVSTAGRINDSWNRLDLTFQGTGVSMDALRSQTSALSASTGRAGGVIRDYFNQMGIAGVTNTQLLSDSFEALAGKSYQTGQSIESMEAKMQTMVLTGNASNRMLKTLGLSAEDLAAAMGVSADQVNEAFKNMTPEERLQAIAKAMGDGAEANEMYKNSYEGLKAQADAAMAGLMGAIGQAILPIVVPALQAATQAIRWLTDGFKALPGPVQAVIGGVGGFAAIALTLIGVLGTVGQVFKMVKGGLEALHLITKLETLANYALAVSEWLVANPLILVAALVIALAAAFVWAYYNVDWFREAVDNLASAIQSFVSGALTYLTQFTESIGLDASDWRQAILGFILFIPQLPLKLGEALVNALAKALGFGDNFTGTMRTAAVNAVENFVAWVGSLPGKFAEEVDAILAEADRLVQELPGKIAQAGLGMLGSWIGATGESSPGFMYDAFCGEIDAMLGLTPGFTAALVNAFFVCGLQLLATYLNTQNTLMSNVISFGSRFVSQLGSIAQRGVSAFSNAIQGIVSALQNCLSWAYNVVMSSPLVSALQWLGEKAAWAFSVLGMGQRSPGKIVKAMRQELDWTSEVINRSGLAEDTARLGESLSDSFNPELNGAYAAGSAGFGGVVGGDTIINVYGDVDSDKRVEQIVDAVRRELNWDNKTAGRSV